MQYRCYFFGTNGQLVGAETIIMDSESEALAAARKPFAQRAHAAGYELRQGKRSIEAREFSRQPRFAVEYLARRLTGRTPRSRLDHGRQQRLAGEMRP